MTLTHRNALSIAEIVVYIPCLITAIFLTFRHGFNKSAGWYFLVIFCLARTIGPAMQLATISNPTSTALYTGYTILQNIGLSPLFLATLGLLSRLIDNINRSHQTLISSRVLKFIETILVVGLILGIVGGIDASEDVVKNGGVYKVPTISKVSTGLFIAGYVAIVFSTILISFSLKHAETGEKRILLAVIISLPFLFVRLIYSSISTFGHSKHFSPLTGSIILLVCVALIEEFIIVVVYEGTGLTLNKISDPYEATHIEAQDLHPHGHNNDNAQYTSSGRKQGDAQPVRNEDNILLKIAKKTIIGKIVMSSRR